MNILNSNFNNILFVSLLGGLVNETASLYIVIFIGLVFFIITLIIIWFVLKANANRRKFEYYKKMYPNAFSIFCHSVHIEQWENYNEIKKKEIKEILSHTIDEWKNTEKQENERIEQEKFIEIRYNEIKQKYPDGLNCWKQTYPNTTKTEIVLKYLDIIAFDERHKNFLFIEEWEREQDYFSKLCRSQTSKMPHCGYYHYNINLSKVNYKGEKMNTQCRIWQFFFSGFCVVEDLDYTYFQRIQENYRHLNAYKRGMVDYPNYIYGEILCFIKSLNIPVQIIISEDECNENAQIRTLSKKLLKEGYEIKDWFQIGTIKTKNIIVIEAVTFNDKLMQNCEIINEECKRLKPSIAYISLLKEVSNNEMQNLIKKKNAEIEEQKNEEQKKAKINQETHVITEDRKSIDIELAENQIKILKEKLRNSSIDKEIKDIVNSEELEFGNRSLESINDNWEFYYVDYLIPSQFIQESQDWKYAVAKFPTKGNIVFPYRRRSIARRGYMELNFQSYLQNVLGNQLLIIDDCSILPAENYRPYEPDIAIIDLKQPSIRIDIEIDEPYSAISNQPIHFIGCGDDFRDKMLNNLGWIVIRLTEYQVVSDMQRCAAFITQIIHAINPNISICTSFLTCSLPIPVKRWSEIEAKIMVSEKAREKYLNHEFGIKETEPITLMDIKQNNEERQCARLVKPLIVHKAESSIIANSNVHLERDENIQFSSFEHIYLYKGNTRLVPVSNIISYFFKPFDSLYWSDYKARQRGVSQGQVLEEWDEKGTRSREVGTFMHQQIERCYNGLEYKNEYHFRYSGKYVKTDEYINLWMEHKQFESFRCNHTFVPFKIEWAIYDERLKIAGTIDMICKKDTQYDIYDWKRSHRIVNAIGKPISTNSYGERGIRGLENIHDTVYWHYCLQQNLYRFILEKNYRIQIDKMYLVVFGDNTINYTKLEVPRMDDAIKVIVDFCSKNNIVQLLLD